MRLRQISSGGFNPRARGRVEAVATPVIDPADSTLLLWFDSSDASSISDTGGLVDEWADKSANGNDLTASGSNRPTTGANTQNSLNVLDFGGANSMALDTTIVSKSAGSLYAVTLNTDASNGSAIVARTTSYGANFLIQDAAAGTSFRLNSGGVGSVNSDGAANEFQVTSALWSGTTSSLFINSNDDNNTVTAGTPDFSVGVVGDYNATAFDMTGDICEILYFEGEHTDERRLEIEQYLADKWAVAGGYSAVPSNDTAPAITGTENVGEDLTVSSGEWISYLPVTSYTYQWKRDGVSISGATSSTYTLVALDETETITCDVTAVNANGSATQVSNSTGAIGEEITLPTVSLRFNSADSEYLTKADSLVADYDRDVFYAIVSMKNDGGAANPILCAKGQSSTAEWQFRQVGSGIEFGIHNGTFMADAAFTIPSYATSTHFAMLVVFDGNIATAADRVVAAVDGSYVTVTGHGSMASTIRDLAGDLSIGAWPDGTGLFDGDLFQLTLGSGYKPTLSDVFDDDGKLKDVSGLTGVFSAPYGTPTVVDDNADADDFTNNNGVTTTSDVP